MVAMTSQAETTSTQEVKALELLTVTIPSPTFTRTFVVYPTEKIRPTPTLFILKDDFQSGMQSFWKVLEGQPVVVNGWLVAQSNVWLEVENSDWDDFVIQFQANSPTCSISDNYNAVSVRGDNLDDMVAFVWSRCERGWFTRTAGNWGVIGSKNIKELANLQTITISEGYAYELLANVHIKGNPNDYSKRIEMPDVDFPIGNIMIKLMNGARIDDVEIIKR
jgi:hypothetical protein